MAKGLDESRLMRAARYLKVGDHVLVPSASGLGMTHAVLMEKRPGRRHFSRGTAYDLIVENDASIHTHPSDARKTWSVYALGEDKFRVEKRAPGPALPPGTSRG
jgi:hypothetical protein